MNVGKAAEAKDPFLPTGVNMICGSRWKAKRLAEWDDPAEWKILIASHSPSMEQLREKFGGMEIHAAATQGAAAATISPGAVKTPTVLETPSPPMLQPVAPVATAVAKTLAQTAVAFITPPPPLQAASPVAPAMVGAPAQALTAGVLTPAAAAGIAPPG